MMMNITRKNKEKTTVVNTKKNNNRYICCLYADASYIHIYV